MNLGIAAIALLTGALIGMVGVGGILLPPLLSLFGYDLHTAMAASSLSFLFTGIVGTWSYAFRRSISWRTVTWLSVGMIPSAVAGARANQLLSSTLLTIALGLLLMFSGIHTLVTLFTFVPDFKDATHSTPGEPRGSDHPAPNGTALNAGALVAIGIAVGFGSALTGTGGPVLLIPLLIPLGVSALYAVGVSQAIQLPIAVFASVGHLATGQLDVRLGVMLGVIQSLSVVAGANIAHRLPSTTLKQCVAAALAVVGAVLIARVVV